MLTVKIGDCVKVSDPILSVTGVVEDIQEDTVQVLHDPWRVVISSAYTYSGDGHDTFNVSNQNVDIIVIDGEASKETYEQAADQYREAVKQLGLISSMLKILATTYDDEELISKLDINKVFLHSVIPFKKAYTTDAKTVSDVYAKAIAAMKQLGYNCQNLCGKADDRNEEHDSL